MKTTLLLFLCLGFIQAKSQEAKEIPVKTDISEVTVFIEGAQITRKKSIDLLKGKSVLKFVSLSPYLDPKSIQIKANENIMVESVNHQINYSDSTNKSNELIMLTEKLKKINNSIIEQNASLEVINEELSFLKDNRNIGGKDQETNFTNLRDINNYYRERITAIKQKQIEINRTISDLNDQKNAIENQIRETAGYKPKPTSEILVSLNALATGKFQFELTYFTANAGWLPSYDIRAKSIDDPIEIIYKANVHQNTKEDWKNIKLRLSTNNPNKSGMAPKLKTYFLDYYTLPPSYSINNQNNTVRGHIYDVSTNEPLPGANIIVKGTTIGTVSDVEGNFSLSLPSNSNVITVSYIGYEAQDIMVSNPTVNVGLNESLQELQQVVVVGYGSERSEDIAEYSPSSSSKAVKKDKVYKAPLPVVESENQTSIEFEIKLPYTIPSDGKNLVVDIENYSMNSSFEYHCVPKIDKDAFLVANITDWEKYNLLEGEANIFFENTYIGKSVLDLRHAFDTLTISLGRDKNVIVKREKIKDFSKKQFIGNKKIETRTWQIQVKNNKKQKINLLMYDQLPVSTLEEIEVSAENISNGSLTKENGEILWKLELEPATKKDIELKYTVKYPKSNSLYIE